MPHNFSCQRFNENNFVVPAEALVDSARLNIKQVPEPQGCQVYAPFYSQSIGLQLTTPSSVGTNQRVMRTRSEFYSSLMLRSLLSQQAVYEDTEQNYRFNVGKMPNRSSYLGR
jgi:hypothetical protein